MALTTDNEKTYCMVCGALLSNEPPPVYKRQEYKIYCRKKKSCHKKAVKEFEDRYGEEWVVVSCFYSKFLWVGLYESYYQQN